MPLRNLICITIDGLQAGMLGPYGNAWIRTPSVNHFASQSFVFDQAYACDPSLETVLQALWPEGLFGKRTATLFTNDPKVDVHFSAAVFSEKKLYKPLQENLTADTVEETDFGILLCQATEWLGKAREPFCLWLHSHGMTTGAWDAPYDFRDQYADEEDPPPPDFVAPPDFFLKPAYDPDELLGIQQAYAGQVSAFDECLGVLLETLDELPFAKNTLVVLLGVRGFPLGEHLRVGLCDSALYNELTHIPFLVRLPDGTGALNRSQALVTHADVPALISDWLNSAMDPMKVESIGLNGLIHSAQIPWRDHLLFHSQHDRAIRTPGWYLRAIGPAENPRQELYVKPDDRCEVNDVADRCQEITVQLAEVLASPQGKTLGPLSDGLVTTVE